MRERDIEKHFFFDKTEAQDLARKAKKAGLSESALVRQLVRGYSPREKPDDRFFEVMRQLAAFVDSMSQIARKANALGLVDAQYYKQQAEQLQKFRLDVREHFILPEKIK